MSTLTNRKPEKLVSPKDFANGKTFQHKRPLEEFEVIQSHGGLGLSVTDKGVIFSALIHFAAYLPSALCILGAFLGGYWNWLTFFVSPFLSFIFFFPSSSTCVFFCSFHIIL